MGVRGIEYRSRSTSSVTGSRPKKRAREWTFVRRARALLVTPAGDGLRQLAGEGYWPPARLDRRRCPPDVRKVG